VAKQPASAPAAAGADISPVVEVPELAERGGWPQAPQPSLPVEPADQPADAGEDVNDAGH
jgi:hypothetical protein